MDNSRDNFVEESIDMHSEDEENVADSDDSYITISEESSNSNYEFDEDTDSDDSYITISDNEDSDNISSSSESEDENYEPPNVPVSGNALMDGLLNMVTAFTSQYKFNPDADKDPNDASLPTSFAHRTREEVEIATKELSHKHKLVSLEKLCLRIITAEIPSYVVRKQFQETLKRTKIIDGPFDRLSAKFLDKIHDEYEKLCEDEEIPCRSTVIFMTEHAENLKIVKISTPNDSKFLFETIQNKCQKNLHKLSLLECKVSVATLDNLLKTLKNLTVLDLSGTKITDNTLAVIIDNMGSLIELNLKKTGLTEKGIKLLLSKRKLRNLNKLILTDTMDDSENAFEILYKILNRYPNLSVLEHSSMCIALKLWRTLHSNKLTKLTSLEIIRSKGRTEKLCHGLVKHCPELTQFSVNNSYFDLSLRYTFCKFRISPHFASETVTKVSLNFITINVTDLLSGFPNLNDLSLHSCALKSSPEGYNIESIKKFHFSDCRYKNCIDFIKDIFYSENLEEISLYRCKYPQRFMLDSSRSMHFKHLRTACIPSDWVQEIMIRNKKLQSFYIECAEMFEGDDCNRKVATYFRDVFSGKRQVFSYPSTSRMQSALDYYNGLIQDEFVTVHTGDTDDEDELF